jgi:tRNA(Ser,Leu) C12 N-acetylase TAN1
VKDWNVVISLYQGGFRRAVRALQRLGQVDRSPYHNVVVMRVDDQIALLEAIEQKTEEVPALYDAIARVAPAQRTFEFGSADELMAKSSAILHEWSSRIAGQSFHARVHRRGKHADFRAHDIEKFLDDTALAASQAAGAMSKIAFDDPDVVIVFDTVDDRAGGAIWTRAELAQHRLLKPD